MSFILETERLVIRQLTLDDAPFILELVNTPGWLEFIGDRGIKTIEQAENYLLNGPIYSYARNGFGLNRVSLKTNDTPIGLCGLLKRDTLDYPDIGFAFLPDYMGKGYAVEVATATLLAVKDQLNEPTILAITLPNNLRSIRLLEKIGLAYVKPIRSADDRETLALYST